MNLYLFRAAVATVCTFCGFLLLLAKCFDLYCYSTDGNNDDDGNDGSDEDNGINVDDDDDDGLQSFDLKIFSMYHKNLSVKSDTIVSSLISSFFQH